MVARTYVNLFETVDGGQTWIRRAVPVPSALTGDGTRALAPAMHGRKGVLLVTFMHRGGGAPVTVTYITRDAGTTAWRPVSRVVGQAVAVSFPDSRHGWMVTMPGPSVWRTIDGGASWRRVATPDATFGVGGAATGPASVGSFEMVSSRMGWLLLRWPNLANPPLGTSRLLVTTDGGRTWGAPPPPSG
jgi:photosystem II stability/assembly factor-like uncharacterized protein